MLAPQIERYLQMRPPTPKQQLRVKHGMKLSLQSKPH